MNVPKSRNETSDNRRGRASQPPKTENSVGARVVEALGDRDVLWLSERTSIPKNTLLDYIRRGITRADNAYEIARALDVSVDWLLGGETLPRTVAHDISEVPLLDIEVSAGGGAIGLETGNSAETIAFPSRWLREEFGSISGLRIVRVTGDSQEPILHAGDWLMIDKNKNQLADGLYVVLLDDFLMVKRLQVEGRVISLLSATEYYPPIRIEGKESDDRLKLIGRAVWAGKRLS